MLCCAVALCAPAYAAPRPGDAKLKDDFEVVYNTWRLHMMRGNYDGWRATTAAHRQVKVRNLAVSEKRPWPATLFHQPMAPPPLSPLTYVGSVLDGPTAAVTYFGMVDLGLGEKPKAPSALVLLFTNERGKWKYDQSRFFNLGRLPAVKERLQRGDATVLMEQDGFQPLGKIPPIQPLCPAPKYIAKILVDCPGRMLTATVNNISTHEFENTRQADVISGGVRDGLNIINLNFRDSKLGEKGGVLVEVYIMPETPGYLPARVYSKFTAPNTQPQSGTVMFHVTPEHIKSMNPANRPTKPTKPAK